MTEIEKALKLHEQGNNCAQAILGAFAHRVDMDVNTAIKIGSGLGGGIGRRQHICGAINAGAIILGLKHSNGIPGDISIQVKSQGNLFLNVSEYWEVLNAKIY